VHDCALSFVHKKVGKQKLRQILTPEKTKLGREGQILILILDGSGVYMFT
jgi:hypothetical protein